MDADPSSSNFGPASERRWGANWGPMERWCFDRQAPRFDTIGHYLDKFFKNFGLERVGLSRIRSKVAGSGLASERGAQNVRMIKSANQPHLLRPRFHFPFLPPLLVFYSMAVKCHLANSGDRYLSGVVLVLLINTVASARCHKRGTSVFSCFNSLSWPFKAVKNG